MKVRARNKPISSVPDRAKCQETGISALGWLRGLERREGRLPLSSGPRASLPALAGKGAASGVYHTPEGSPPGACLDQGLGSTHLAVKGCDQAADHYLLDVGPGAASVQKRLLRQRVNCCVARAQAGVLLRRLKFALPGWAQAEKRRRKDERDQAAQRAAQARAYSGEGHSEEWRFEFSRSYPH